MRKGFTLIELLTVISILGLITLIAVPTVTKIVKEAKRSAFETSNINLMKTMTEECKSNVILKVKPTLNYIIKDGKLNVQLDVKGTMPNEGYVILDNKCDVLSYFFKNDNYTYGEDEKENYMLKANNSNESVFKTLYSSYYNNIKNIYFVNHLDIPNNAIEVKDPSLTEEGKIKSWLIPASSTYDLYVGSEGTILGNYNSSYLFFQMNINKIDLTNFYTSLVENMAYMFGNCFYLQDVNVKHFDTSNVTNMNAMFLSCNVISSLDLSGWDTSNVTNMNHLFCNAFYLKYLDLSNWDTSKVTNMSFMFAANNETNTPMDLITLDISNFDFSKVTSMDNMFQLTYYLHKIYVPDAKTANIIDDHLIVRSTEYPGTITIIGNKTGLDTTILASKNWNVA